MASKLDAMREGGKVLGRILKELEEYVGVGRNEIDVNKWVEGKILEYGAEVAYYESEVDFPGAICISVNDELIHGIPKDREFEDGDKVSFDLTIKYKGYYVDSTICVVMGKGSAMVRKLVSVTESAMWEGIEQVRAGAKLGTVGNAIENALEKGGLSVILNYVGHGIGETMHEKPDVPNYGDKGHGYTLKAGDVICIEPMSSLGKADNYVEEDGWTVSLKDGSIGAHVEHTVLVTEDGYEVLTLREGER